MSTRPQIPPQQLEDPFRVWLPLAVERDRDSLFKAATDLPDSVLVKGLVSSELRDLEGELIRQDGIDWSWFMKHGRITLGHPATSKNTIGSPRQLLKATLDDGTPATWLESNLWLRKPLAQEAYRDHQAALAAGDAGMGYSIEGNALERDTRDPSIVCKAIVYTVAIAFQPINPATQLDPIQLVQGLAKAMGMSIGNDGEGFDLEAVIRSLTGLFAQSKKAIPPLPPHRLSLLKGVSDDELRALRLLRKCPDLTFADAVSVAASLKQGSAR